MLQYLWGMINALQIIVLTSLFKLKIPESAEIVMIMILKLCQLEVLSTEGLIEIMFDFTETLAYETDYDSEG